MKLLYSNKSESINQSISPWSSLSPVFPFFSFSFGGLTFGLIGRKTLRFWPFFRQLAVTSLAQTRYTLHRHFPEKHPSKRQTAHKTCPLLFLSYSSTVYMSIYGRHLASGLRFNSPFINLRQDDKRSARSR